MQAVSCVEIESNPWESEDEEKLIFHHPIAIRTVNCVYTLLLSTRLPEKKEKRENS